MKRKPVVQVQVNAGMTNRKAEWRKFVTICHRQRTTAAAMLRRYIYSVLKRGVLR